VKIEKAEENTEIMHSKKQIALPNTKIGTAWSADRQNDLDDIIRDAIEKIPTKSKINLPTKPKHDLKNRDYETVQNRLKNLEENSKACTAKEYMSMVNEVVDLKIEVLLNSYDDLKNLNYFLELPVTLPHDLYVFYLEHSNDGPIEARIISWFYKRFGENSRFQSTMCDDNTIEIVEKRRINDKVFEYNRKIVVDEEGKERHAQRSYSHRSKRENPSKQPMIEKPAQNNWEKIEKWLFNDEEWLILWEPEDRFNDIKRMGEKFTDRLIAVFEELAERVLCVEKDAVTFHVTRNVHVDKINLGVVVNYPNRILSKCIDIKKK
jgi:hypothetical protein